MAKKKATHGGKRPGAGRKPKGGPTPVRTVRVSDAHWDEFRRAADAAGVPLSKWIIDVLLKAARR